MNNPLIPATAPSSPNRLKWLVGDLDVSVLRGIEIAPLSRATVKKTDGDITYVDRLSHADLCAMHGGAPYISVSDILPVDIVLGDEQLPSVWGARPRVDYVVGSHVIEHVSDLVSWFADIKAVLKHDGVLRLAVPDKRYTFDRIRQETKLSEVLSAYAQRAKTPTSQCLVDHILNVRKVDFIAAWDGTLNEDALEPFHTPDEAIAAATTTPANHLDIHCWVYTPTSFAGLMLELSRLGLMPFACEAIIPTEPYTFEFFVRMRVSDDQAAISTSWAAQLAAAKPIAAGAAQYPSRASRWLRLMGS